MGGELGRVLQAIPPAAAGGPGQGTEEGRRGTTARPPPSPNSPPPPARGKLKAGQGGAGPLCHPCRWARGGPPPPRRAAAPSGERCQAHTPRAPAGPPARSQTDPDRLAVPRGRTRTPGGPHPGSARGHEPEQYGDHALPQLSDADATCFGARRGEAEGRTVVERPPAPWGPPAAPPRGGSTQAAPPPPPRPAYKGAVNREPSSGKKGPGRPPLKQARQRMGLRQETRRGTDRMERPYRRPAQERRQVRARHRPREGRRTPTPRECERTRTQRARGEYQKGNQTKPAESTDLMEWRTGGRG